MMNEQVNDRSSSQSSSSDRHLQEATDSFEFVSLDEIDSPVLEQDLNLGFQEPSRDTPKGKAPREETVRSMTERRKASDDQEAGSPQPPPQVVRQSTKIQKRCKIEPPNELSEEKVVSLDGLQGRLSAILGVSDKIERSEEPRRDKVFSTLERASSEPTEEPRASESNPKTKASTKNPSTTCEAAPEAERNLETRRADPSARERLEPQDSYRPAAHEHRDRSCSDELRTASSFGVSSGETSYECPEGAPYVSFGRSSHDDRERSETARRLRESQRERDEGFEERENDSLEYPVPDHRSRQNEYYQNLCALCHFAVPVYQPFAIELNGYFYHKRCVLDLFFTREELYVALRSRCRKHPRADEFRRNRTVWQGITRKLSKCFKRN